MSFRVWGVPFSTSEMLDTTHYQPVKMNTDLILKAVRIWVIVYNDPAFTDLNMKIYSDDPSTLSHVPKKLLHTSTNSITKTEMITLENGVKEIYFEFDNANLQGSTWYNFVLNGTGYTGDSSSHIAWRQAFPDPVYATNLTISMSKINTFPFTIYAIGAEF